ncbi:MAG: hypothetical protein JW832_02995 [Deltaproteobacteria bacterium]|nr:hypothetical protein [Deltaproteobacteria bacterium]
MKRLFVLVLILCWLAPAFASAPLRTQHFVFYAGPEGQKAAAYLAQSADAILQNMAASLGMQPGAVIDVHVVRDFEELYRSRPDAGRLPSWAAGAAYPEKNLIVLLINRGAGLDKTFLHETHHMLLGQAFKGGERVPRWLDEGLAMIWADEWSLSRLNTMTMAVLSGKLLPMDELAVHFPSDLRAAEIAYCQSFYFIAFLKSEFGNEAFQRFFREYIKHKDFTGALRLAYKMDWSELEKLWLKHTTLRFSWIPLITSTSTLWFAAALLFIAGYIRKKRKARQILLAWQQEESCSPDTRH